MKHKYFFFITGLFSVWLILLFPAVSSAQQPTTQDCLGAIPVCDYIYEEANTATGSGNYFEIPYGGSGCPNNHCMDGERNSRWYIFTVVESGHLKFQITPSVSSDDYDWAVFNLTNHHCEDIYNGAPLMMSSCNAAGGAGYQGATGISSANGGFQHCNNGGNTNKWNADLPVFQGQTYVLVVSDWTQTPGGYTLDFSSSTASIFDDQSPYVDYIGSELITACGTNELSFSFNENVRCSTVSPGSFTMAGPGGPYVLDSIYGENCELGGTNEREYTLYFTPPITMSGEYTLEVRNFNFISDACNNFALAEIHPFTINMDTPDADAGEDIDIGYGQSTTLTGSATGGTGNFSFHWEPASQLVDPDIQNPTTVNLTNSTDFTLTVEDTLSNCVGTDQMRVNVVGGPLDINIGASATEICETEIVNLFAYPDGGSGEYTFNWTSSPAGFTSQDQNPSDYPVVTTTYFLEISDGFTTLDDEITIQVNPKPGANAGIDQTINEGTSTVLNGSGTGGTGNYSYLWAPGSLLEQNDIPNPTTYPLSSPTVFTLLITDVNGCESEPDEMWVFTEGPALGAFPLAVPNKICLGDTVTISANATGGGDIKTYLWTAVPGGQTYTDSVFKATPGEDVRYDLLVTDEYDNEFTAHVIVTVHDLPVIDLIPDNMVPSGPDSIKVCVRDTLWLDAGYDDDPLGTTYFWNDNLSGRYYRTTTNGIWLDNQTHHVFVKHGVTGCENTGHITVVFDYNECEIGVPENKPARMEKVDLHPNPNAGSFTLTVNEELKGLTVTVFDVSGRLVFNRHWDGMILSGHRQKVDAGKLDKGLYFVHLKSDGKRGVLKMIVQ